MNESIQIIFKLIFLILFISKFNSLIKSKRDILEQQLRIKLNCLGINDKVKQQDFEYILNYKGNYLEPEWEWVKNISFVYTWVDGSDVNLAYIKSKYNGGNRKVNSRDRSADELQYSLRSLKKYLPWHNGTIFIVTDNQVPKWLDTNNSQIKIIGHEEIIPKYINPTFDSFTIECFLDNIPGISDIFIYMNDDFFFNNYVHPSFFFTSETFTPKIYRTNYEIINMKKIDKVIKENDIHNIYSASIYFTYQIIHKYFDRNFTYYHLAHCAYVCYRSFFTPFRQFFEEELKVVFSYRFRSPFKPIPLYLYQTLLLYSTKKIETNSSPIYEKKLIDFRKQYLNGNSPMSNCTFELIPENISNIFTKFSFVNDVSKSNFEHFNFFRTHKNILAYNLNDKYNNSKSLFEFTLYMITTYPENNTFEKINYVNLEKKYLCKLKYVDDNIKYNDYYINEKKLTMNFHKMFFNKYNLNYIKEYLEERNKFSINQNISLIEKEEIEFLFKYDGRDLEPEWKWVQNISIVYIITDNENKKINELKYSLRSIERFLPWFIGTIFIIIQRTNLFWINIKNPHIKIINPLDIIPTEFNCNYTRQIIEMYLDKIPSITERFIILNQNHYFMHFIHPRFFFNNEYYPKYNFVQDLEQKTKTISSTESFFKTYKQIKKIFGNNINNYGFMVNSPISLFRDLFQPVRELYLTKNIEDNNQSFILLPLYLLSTYNIYGSAQIYYPKYVSGFGEIRNTTSPILNTNRTISYYGFDITSEIILKKAIVNVDLFEDIEKIFCELEKSDALIFCFEINKILNNSEIKSINNFLQKYFENKSLFEI